MKKFWVFLAIVCIIGGVVCIAASGTNGMNFSWNWETLSTLELQNLDKEHRDIKSYDSTKISGTSVTIELTLLDCSVVVKFGDLSNQNVVETNLPDEHHKFTVEAKSDSLTIVQNERVDKNFTWLNTLLGQKDKRYVVITLSNSLLGNVNLDIKMDIGSVNISDADFSDVEIGCDTGAVVLEKILANDVDIKVDTGAVVLKNITATNFDIETDTGAITATNVTADNFEASIETGAVNSTNLTAKTVNLSTNTGAVNCTNLRDCDVLTINVDTGEVNVSMYAVKSEYTLVVSVDTGKKNISNQTGSQSGKSITVSVDTGAVEFKFKTP